MDRRARPPAQPGLPRAVGQDPPAARGGPRRAARRRLRGVRPRADRVGLHRAGLSGAAEDRRGGHRQGAAARLAPGHRGRPAPDEQRRPHRRAGMGRDRPLQAAGADAPPRGGHQRRARPRQRGPQLRDAGRHVRRPRGHRLPQDPLGTHDRARAGAGVPARHPADRPRAARRRPLRQAAARAEGHRRLPADGADRGHVPRRPPPRQPAGAGGQPHRLHRLRHDRPPVAEAARPAADDDRRHAGPERRRADGRADRLERQFARPTSPSSTAPPTASCSAIRG